MTDIDQRIRIAAFNWLDEQVGSHGDVLPRSILAQGFEFEGQRVPLVAPTGIFKPRVLPQMPLNKGVKSAFDSCCKWITVNRSLDTLMGSTNLFALISFGD